MLEVHIENIRRYSYSADDYIPRIDETLGFDAIGGADIHDYLEGSVRSLRVEHLLQLDECLHEPVRLGLLKIGTYPHQPDRP